MPEQMLVDCRACGKPVSRSAVSCPACGHPGKRAQRLQLTAVLGITIAFIGMLSYLGYRNEQRREQMEARTLQELTRSFHALEQGNSSADQLCSYGQFVIAMVGDLRRSDVKQWEAKVAPHCERAESRLHHP